MGPTRIALLTPNAELPGEYLDAASDAAAELLLWMIVTEAPDSHEIADLLAMGETRPLSEAAFRAVRWHADAVVWACTSGSFVCGREGSRRQVELLSEVAGCPATSTSLAFVAALVALGVKDVSILSPYPEPATQAFERYLADWGIAVSNSFSLNHPGAGSSRTITAAEVKEMATDLGRTEPLLIPDTAVWGFELLRELGGIVRQPILVANQVTLWHGVQTANVSTNIAALGVLRGLQGPSVRDLFELGGVT